MEKGPDKLQTSSILDVNYYYSPEDSSFTLYSQLNFYPSEIPFGIIHSLFTLLLSSLLITLNVGLRYRTSSPSPWLRCLL